MVTRTSRHRRLLCDASPEDTDGYSSSGLSGSDSDDSDDDVFDYESDDSCSTTLTEPEPAFQPHPGHTRPHAASSESPEYSDDPDDDTDEDLANVPLDYGRSEKTKRVELGSRNGGTSKDPYIPLPETMDRPAN